MGIDSSVASSKTATASAAPTKSADTKPGASAFCQYFLCVCSCHSDGLRCDRVLFVSGAVFCVSPLPYHQDQWLASLDCVGGVVGRRCRRCVIAQTHPPRRQLTGLLLFRFF